MTTDQPVRKPCWTGCGLCVSRWFIRGFGDVAGLAHPSRQQSGSSDEHSARVCFQPRGRQAVAHGVSRGWDQIPCSSPGGATLWPHEEQTSACLLCASESLWFNPPAGTTAKTVYHRDSEAQRWRSERRGRRGIPAPQPTVPRRRVSPTGTEQLLWGQRFLAGRLSKCRHQANRLGLWCPGLRHSEVSGPEMMVRRLQSYFTWYPAIIIPASTVSVWPVTRLLPVMRLMTPSAMSSG